MYKYSKLLDELEETKWLRIKEYDVVALSPLQHDCMAPDFYHYTAPFTHGILLVYNSFGKRFSFSLRYFDVQCPYSSTCYFLECVSVVCSPFLSTTYG
jgi:hypothetical protein